MVEIFKTDISNGAQAKLVLRLLGEQWPQYTANFDLEDCDRILRIESASVENEKIISLLSLQGFLCETLN